MMISLDTVIKVFAAIATVYGGAVILVKPIRKAVDNLNKHDREITELKKAAEDAEDRQKAIMTAMLAMINHMIDGNGIEGLKKVRNDLQKDLIDKK